MYDDSHRGDANQSLRHNGRPAIGANPIIWSNDDFRDLGGDIPLEVCLAQMAKAGFAGCELGHKYPRTANELTPLLDHYDLQLVSGWHSTYLLEKSIEQESRAFSRHLELLSSMGSPVVIVAECSRRTYDNPDLSLQWDDRQALWNDEEWDKLCRGLEQLAHMSEQLGLRTVYHHHMGTLIQNEAEINTLMAGTRKLQLLVDTGHLTLAGVDPIGVLQAHGSRVGHVHLKDVRWQVAEEARQAKWSFATSVRQGVFTVPGDGDVDFPAFFAGLRQQHYRGWYVVEAEQDPSKAEPFTYAKRGYEYVQQQLSGHGNGGSRA